MNKMILFGFFATSSVMSQVEGIALPNPPQYNQQRPIYVEQQPFVNVPQIQNPVVQEDIINLTDGSKIIGKLVNLPPLVYPFGAIPLKIEDAREVSFSSDHGTWKVYIENIDGTNYISDFPDESSLELKKADGQIRRLPFIEIANIHLYRRGNYTPKYRNAPFFMIEFKDGSLLPAEVGNQNLVVNDGQKDYSINIQQLIDIHNDNGLHGIIRLNNGQFAHIPLAIVKDNKINIVPLESGQKYDVDWRDIARIYQHNLNQSVASGPTFTPANPVNTPNAQQKNSLQPVNNPPSVIPVRNVTSVPQPTAQPPVVIHPSVQKTDVTPAPSNFVVPKPANSTTVPTAPSVPSVQTPAAPTVVPKKPAATSSDIEFAYESDAFILTPVIAQDGKTTLYKIVGKLPTDKTQAGAAITSIPTDIAIIGEDITYTPKKKSLRSEDDGDDEDALKDVKKNNGISEDIIFTVADESNKYLLAPGGAVRKPALAQRCILRDDPLVAIVEEKPVARISNKNTDPYMDNDGYYQGPIAKINPPNEVEEVEFQDPDMAGMAYISDKEVACAEENGQPASKEIASAFYIDKYPVSNKQYYRFVKATNYPRPKSWQSGRVPRGQDLSPITDITYKDALAYATWAGKRLPTASEWCRANHSNLIKTTTKRQVKEWTATSFNAEEDSRAEKNWLEQNNSQFVQSTYRAIVGGGLTSPAPLREDEVADNVGFRTALEAQ